MFPCLRDGRPDLGAAGLRDREGEHGVEEEARDRDRDDQQAGWDQNGAAHDGEGFVVQHVRLEIEHRQPDPHRREDLHEGEPPVGDEQPEPVEQHHERADGERERGEDAPRLAEPQDRLLDLGFVVVLDGPHERPDTRQERSEPPLASAARGC